MEKRVVELFAGVGGFRVGLNSIKSFKKDGSAIEHGNYKIVWSNQWEPSTKKQDAFDCYSKRFPSDNNSNIDITKINKKTIPTHDLLVGGFPCQDYSVAHTISKSKGIEGKKGVLWWEINSILKAKNPPFVLLENVDRLLKSPAAQRGRDFGIILRCFNDLNYSVQWRVINAGEYGFPQRRRRIFIFAYKNNTNYAKNVSTLKTAKLFNESGIFQKPFKVAKISEKQIKQINIVKKYSDLVAVSNKFKFEFQNCGIMTNGVVKTVKVIPLCTKIKPLKDIVITSGVESKFYLTKQQKNKFSFLRGSKKIKRTKPNGDTYYYSEGAMSTFDSLDLPGRTMLTSECSTNRSTHIILDPKTNSLRFLTPVECERLNQFPDNWTNTGMTDKRRAFMMGNALVCGIVREIGNEISKIIDDE